MKQKKKQKKKWVRPILTVLTRGEDRQESVLLVCKLALVGSGDVQELFQGCRVNNCTQHCFDWSPS